MRVMSFVNEIEEAVLPLSPADLDSFRIWFAEFDAAAWDRQMEDDSRSGTPDGLARGQTHIWPRSLWGRFSVDQLRSWDASVAGARVGPIDARTAGPPGLLIPGSDGRRSGKLTTGPVRITLLRKRSPPGAKLLCVR
jgi:hypothetical protein